jgi:hypothetical protein
MRDALRAIRQGFVESIELAIALPTRMLSAAVAVIVAFVHHRAL